MTSSEPKRRLPVLQNNGPKEPASDEPPPWHWVPIGVVVSLVAGALLARMVFVPYLTWRVGTVAGGAQSAIRPDVALMGLAVVLLAVAIGGFVVGRFGQRTNPRHGTLAGGITVVLLVLVIGHSLTLTQLLVYLLLVPAAAVASYSGAKLGHRFAKP